jgi:hypothetical protein
MINLSHLISIWNFVFTILFYATRWTKQDLSYICFKKINKNYLNQISNVQQPKNHFMFLFPFFFSVLSHQYSFSYLSGSSHSLSHNFLSAQPAVQSNCTWPNFLWSSLTSSRQPLPLASLGTASLFDVSPASNTVVPPRLIPLFLSENGRTPLHLLPRFHLP